MEQGGAGPPRAQLWGAGGSHRPAENPKQSEYLEASERVTGYGPALPPSPRRTSAVARTAHGYTRARCRLPAATCLPWQGDKRLFTNPFANSF